jgi:hypothetical protein
MKFHPLNDANLEKLNDANLEKLIRQGIPGFEADWTKRVMAQLNAVRPMKDAPTSEPDLAKKYSMLASLIQYRSRVVEMKPDKPEPFVMPEDSGKKYAEQLSKQFTRLLEEKLVQLAPGSTPQSPRYQLTDQGRRFMADYEKEHQG